ncbi:MAG: hypothetical protein GX640_20035, partial [Fibrobacter sp.]|nr:hypothetical protein [Fibrobacter sp.]
MNIRSHILLFFLFLLFITCTEFDPDNHTNPYDPDYKGNYALTVDRSSLPETLVCNVDYTINFETGKDTFSSVIVANPGSPIVSSAQTSDSSIIINFLSPYSGYITLTGIRPNLKTVSDSFYIVSKRLSSDTILPRVLFVERSINAWINSRTEISASDSNNVSEKYVWQFGKSEPDTTSKPFIVKQFSTIGEFRAKVYGIDKYKRKGSFVDSISITVRVPDSPYFSPLSRDTAIFKGTTLLLSVHGNP